MKVLIALLLLTVALGEALKCYECADSGNHPCSKTKTSKTKTCPPGKNFCRVQSLGGHIYQRDCWDHTDIPAGYEAVYGDIHKSCKTFMTPFPIMEKQKDCFCDSDLCNFDTMASPNTFINNSWSS